MKKRLAICFFGHLRTYKGTYQNFFKNIVEPNLKDGWEIDIFMHTWDVFQEKGNSRHTPNMEKLYPTLLGKKVDSGVIRELCDTYKLKDIQVENGTGMFNSVLKVSKIYQRYREMHSIHYDLILYTRPDIMFFNPFRLEDFVGFYINFHLNQTKWGVREKTTFCAMNYFNPLPFIDPRFMNDGDLLWINNFDCEDIPPRKCVNFFVVPIKYNYYIDFLVWREINAIDKIDTPWSIPYVKPWIPTSLEKVKNIKSQLTSKTQELTQTKNQLDSTKQQLDSKVKELDSKTKELSSLPIKKQTLEIKNLEQDLINKQLHTKQLEKELGYKSNVLKELELKNQELIQTKNQLDSTKKQLESTNKILFSNPNPSHLIQNTSCFKGKLAYLNTLTTAKDRIHNHLSYKLGQAMIENSKSLLGYIRMPYVLSYIKDKHKQEQEQYQEAIKKNPNLKLPNLESYPDYKESLKEKECITYKLGEAFIRANTAGGGGAQLFKLPLAYFNFAKEVRKLRRELNEKRKY